jgi:hypothetical protein
MYTVYANDAYAQETPPLSVAPFKGDYAVGMTVTLIGEVVGSFSANDPVSIKVTNPNGQTYKDDSAKLDEEGAFTYQFKLEGSQASVVGVHTIEATYKSLKANGSFEVRERPTLTISTSKSTYDLGDIVTITGKVNPRILSPVEIRIYGFNNTLWKSAAVNADDIRSDGTFSIDIGELMGRNVFAGKYRVDASYADKLATASLTFDAKVTGKVTPGRFMIVDSQGKQQEEVFVGQQVLVQADVRNNLMDKQPFAYIVLITDVDRITVSISWITGTLPNGETLSAAQSWVPDSEGRFTVRAFVWKSVSEPEVLGKALETTITVSE